MSGSDLAAAEFKGLRTTSKLPTRHLDGRAWAEEIWGTAARPREEKEAGPVIPKAGLSQPTSAGTPPLRARAPWRSAQLSKGPLPAGGGSETPAPGIPSTLRVWRETQVTNQEVNLQSELLVRLGPAPKITGC